MKNCSYCDKTFEDTLAICPHCNDNKMEIAPQKKHVPMFTLRELLSFLGF